MRIRMTYPDDANHQLHRQAQADVATLSRICLARGLSLVTAESCTGGLLATLCTDLSGSSRWFQGALVTYQTDAKIHWLDVDPASIDDFGVVSEPVARAMVTGALVRSSANLAVALTGIAGPGGGSPACPVGTVWIAWAQNLSPGQPPQQLLTKHQLFNGQRQHIRLQAAASALDGLLRLLR